MAAPKPFDGLPGEQVICATPAECAARLADAIVAQARQRLQALAHVNVALSGAGSGKMVASALAHHPDLTPTDWARIHVWMVDERCVEHTDPQSNFGMLRQVLLPAVPSENLHAMPVLHPNGARRYEQDLRWALVGRAEPDRCLDAIMLGMGEDGHTASLFPASPALEEREHLIVLNDGPQVTPPRPRMTMTYPLLNQTPLVTVMVTGAAKRSALRRAAARAESYGTLPIAGIVPAGRMIWFLDHAVVTD